MEAAAGGALGRAIQAESEGKAQYSGVHRIPLKVSLGSWAGRWVEFLIFILFM